MTLLLIAVAWMTSLTLIVALCVIARMGDRDREAASLASAAERREQGALLTHGPQRSRKRVRRRQRIAA